MVKTMVNPVNPHRYSPPVPYNSVFKLTFASSGQHEDLFSLFARLEIEDFMQITPKFVVFIEWKVVFLFVNKATNSKNYTFQFF